MRLLTRFYGNLVQVNNNRLKVCPHIDIYTVPVKKNKKNGDVFVPFRKNGVGPIPFAVQFPFRTRTRRNVAIKFAGRVLPTWQKLKASSIALPVESILGLSYCLLHSVGMV